MRCGSILGAAPSPMSAALSHYIQTGIHMVNYPTTLLGMIDAAVGGKNGINLEEVKNVLWDATIFRNPFLLIHSCQNASL